MSEQTLVVGDQKELPGELLYEYTLKFTQVVEYGASADALISGQTPPPVEGARFDIYSRAVILKRALSERESACRTWENRTS